MSHLPAFIAPLRFRDPAAALAQVRAIYDQQIAHLRDAMQRYVGGETLPGHVRACYPFVRIHTDTVARAILETPDIKQLSYGFVAGPGRYETTLTRPDLYSEYYLEQFRLLLKNHDVELEVGTSTQPIPIHFSFAENDHIEGSMSADRRMLMRDMFDLPDLAGQPVAWLANPAGECILRLIEDPQAAMLAPMFRHGWLSLEVLVADVDSVLVPGTDMTIAGLR